MLLHTGLQASSCIYVELIAEVGILCKFHTKVALINISLNADIVLQQLTCQSVFYTQKKLFINICCLVSVTVDWYQSL